MSKYIDADLYVEMQIYDDEHEEWSIWNGTIEDLLNQWTEQGCPQTIEVSEDCISKEPNGVWKAKSFHECFCDNCGFIFDIMKCDFLENMKFCPNCGAKMKGADDE